MSVTGSHGRGLCANECGDVMSPKVTVRGERC